MNRTRCLGCFAAGVLVIAACALAIGYTWWEMQRLTTASTVHQPLLVALTRMQETARTGDVARVAKDLEQLRTCWEVYAFAGGETPELFVRRLDSPGALCKPAQTPES